MAKLNITSKDFRSEIMFHPFKSQLSKSQKFQAFIASVALGVFTLGTFHLACYFKYRNSHRIVHKPKQDHLDSRITTTSRDNKVISDEPQQVKKQKDLKTEIKSAKIVCLNDWLKDVRLPKELPQGANYVLFFNSNTRPNLSDAKFKKILQECDRKLPTIMVDIRRASNEIEPWDKVPVELTEKGLYLISFTVDLDENLINGPHCRAEIEKGKAIVLNDKNKPLRLISNIGNN